MKKKAIMATFKMCIRDSTKNVSSALKMYVDAHPEI